MRYGASGQRVESDRVIEVCARHLQGRSLVNQKLRHIRIPSDGHLMQCGASSLVDVPERGPSLCVQEDQCATAVLKKNAGYTQKSQHEEELTMTIRFSRSHEPHHKCGVHTYTYELIACRSFRAAEALPASHASCSGVRPSLDTSSRSRPDPGPDPGLPVEG